MRPLIAALAALASLGGGCVYDSSDRCGDNMAYVEMYALCVCLPNAAPVGGGCAACAADEVVVNNACVCPAGEAKNADGVCVAP